MKFFEALAQTFAGKPIDWDELEEAFIRADIGVPIATLRQLVSVSGAPSGTWRCSQDMTGSY